MNKDLTYLFKPRPFKELEDCIKDYVTRHCSKCAEAVKNYKRYGKNVPCYECRGEGKISRSGGPREDDYYVDCDKCNNTGVLTREIWRQNYDKIISIWKSDDGRHRKNNEIYIHAFNKLTEEERGIFGHYYNLR